MAKKDDQLLQTGRSSRTGRRSGTPRILWGALALCIVAAAFLFRSPSGDVPTGIGENRSVVTTSDEDLLAEYRSPDPADSNAPRQPRSGEVDLTLDLPALVPETPAQDGADAAPARTSPAPSHPESGRTTVPATRDAGEPRVQRSNPEAPEEPAEVPPSRRPQGPPILPAAEGAYLVQAGSFGTSENADKEAARLRGLGWEPTVRVSNMADGSILYRVRIGYFSSRAQAEAFINQNAARLPGAIPVHR